MFVLFFLFHVKRNQITVRVSDSSQIYMSLCVVHSDDVGSFIQLELESQRKVELFFKEFPKCFYKEQEIDFKKLHF